MSALDPSQEAPKDRITLPQPPPSGEMPVHAPTMTVDSQGPVPPPFPNDAPAVLDADSTASPSTVLPTATPPPFKQPADAQQTPSLKDSKPAPLRKTPDSKISSPPKPRPLAIPKAKSIQPIPLGETGKVVLRLTDEDDEEFEEGQLSKRAFLEAPPWLVSLVIHMTALIVLGLIYLPQIIKETILLDASISEDLGLLIDPDLADEEKIEEPKELVILPEIMIVDTLTLEVPQIEISPDAPLSSNISDSFKISLALNARSPGNQAARVALGSGNSQTQRAVELGLEWLKKNQQRDGSWRLNGPYSNPGADPNPIAATAMALLAFQGAGHTHLPHPGHKVDYSKVVNRGMAFLLKQQDKDGNFYHKGPQHQRLYSQAQATIAICELYGMTKESKFRHPAQLAIDYAVKIQSREGGWRYAPGSDSDLSVTGWFVMALQSGLMAELEVPQQTLYRVSEYLDTVSFSGSGRYSNEKGSRYVYQPGRPATPAMTAEGLLCRQYLGWKRDHPPLIAGVAYVNAHPIRWREKNVYYWYYATQVMHHMGGEPWEQWNNVMKKVIPAEQVRNGKETGSWSPDKDEWGTYAGRLYTTCLCIYMMEVYYRHLPIYNHNID